METLNKKTHPLILIAAGSVSLASLAAAAHFTGLIPTRSAEAPAPLVATAPAAAPAVPAALPPAAAPEAPRLAAKPRAPRHESRSAGEPDRQVRNDDWRYDSGTRRVANNDAGIDVIPSRPQPITSQPPAQQVQAPPLCRECGTVEGVREVETKGEGSGLGAIAGGVLGGVLGNQVGRGKGRDLATVAGAVGGAFAGHQVEKNVRSERQFQVTVRFDDGAVRTYNQTSASGWRNGDRVRLENGSLRTI